MLTVALTYVLSLSLSLSLSSLSLVSLSPLSLCLCRLSPSLFRLFLSFAVSLSVAVAVAILQAYVDASTEATALLGEGHMLSADWNGKGQYHVFENQRAAALSRFRAHLRSKASQLDGTLEALLGESHLDQSQDAAAPKLLAEGQFVEVEIKAKGPLGYVVRVDGQYDGMVYHNDVFEAAPAVGDKTDGWVRKHRPDGKVLFLLLPLWRCS